MTETGPSQAAPAKAAPSGKAVGSPSHACPLASLKVTIKTEGADKTEGKVELKLEGPTGKSLSVEASAGATFEGLEAGDYEVHGSHEGWAEKTPPKVTLAKGGAGSATVTLVKVKLASVTHTGGDVEWFVNQPEDAAKCSGRKVKIKAKLNLEVAGIPIHFAIDAHADNKAGIVADLKPQLSAEELSSDGKGEAEVELTLSRYGGDKVRVSASTKKGTTPGQGDAKESRWFVTWRKVFVEIDNMKRPTGGGTYANNGPFADLRTEYAKHFVKLVNTGADSEPVHERVSHELALGPYCAGLQSGTDTPRTHVVLIDTIIWDPEDQPQEFSVTKLKGTKRFASSATTLDVAQWRKSGSDVHVKITKTGAAAPAWQVVSAPDTHFSMSWNADDFVLAFDVRGVHGLPADTEDLPADVTKVELKMVLKRYIEGSGAKQGTSSIVGMRSRERSYAGDQLKNNTLKTMVHETGHAMGMASKFASDGTTPATYYVLYGSHCNNLSNDCVMYGIAHFNPAYCPVCSDGLRARNLETLPIGGESAL